MPEAATAAAPAPVGAAAVGLAGLLSLAVAVGIGRFAFTPMLPLMIQDGQLDVAAGGWLAAAHYLGYLVGALTASRLPIAPARLAVTTLGLTVLLTAAMALPAGPWAWAGLRLAAGVVSAWAFVATGVWCLGALAHRSGVGGAPSGWSSVLYAGVGTGIALAGLYCLAAAIAGSRSAGLWLQLALMAALLAVPVAWVVRRLGAELDGSMRPVRRAAGAPAALPRMRGLVLSYGLFGFGYILPATFLPVLARSLVDDPRLFGLTWPVFGAAAAVSALLASWWLRRVSRLRVWAVAQALMGVGVLLPSLWRSGWTLGLSALLVGGTFMVVTLAGVQEARSRASAQAARAVARMTAAFAVGQIVGPVLSSALLHGAGLGEAAAMNLAMQLAAASLLVSAVWLARLREPVHGLHSR
ncbi:MAG: YbfB/YjiJ family MFS transporter [Pseudomonadota bacterium]